MSGMAIFLWSILETTANEGLTSSIIASLKVIKLTRLESLFNWKDILRVQLFFYSPASEQFEHLILQALLHSVPIGRLVVLDLFAEVKPIWQSSEQFYGVPYIWKVLFFQKKILNVVDLLKFRIHTFVLATVSLFPLSIEHYEPFLQVYAA